MNFKVKLGDLVKITNPYQYFAPEQPSLDAIMNSPFMVTEMRATSAKVMSVIDINRTFHLLLDDVEKWKA